MEGERDLGRIGFLKEFFFLEIFIFIFTQKIKETNKKRERGAANQCGGLNLHETPPAKLL